MTKTEQATQILEREANDNRYGYLWGGWGPLDFDCGHAIIDAWERSGVPVKSSGAAWTGNMRDVFLQCGFQDVTNFVNLNTGAGMKRGDVLVNRDCHAAQFVGNGKLVHARSSEGNEISGDQNGKEFLVQGYFNYPWTNVLRFNEEEESDSETSATDEPKDTICGPEVWAQIAKRMPTVKLGDAGWAVATLQSALNYLGADLDIDGDFGSLTESALWMFQHEAK